MTSGPKRKDPKRKESPAKNTRARGGSGPTVLIASDWAPIRAFEAPIAADPESVYGDLLPILRGADLRVVNCECALTAARRPVCKSGSTFKGAPRHVRGLTSAGFEVACLANNHVLDYGVAGLQETLGVLHRSGVLTVGAGLSEEEAYEPLRLRAGRQKVHIVNFSEGEDLTCARGGPGVFGWDIPRAADLVRRSKRAGGAVIAIGHCGLEYVPYPPPYVAAAFRALVDAGADCVIGHHPHVPQGIEQYEGRPIFYSLGNFVFYQYSDLYYRKTGFLVTLRLSEDTVSGYELHPYRIAETGLRRLEAGEQSEFRRKLARISRPLTGPAETEKAWRAYLAWYGIAGFAGEVKMILEKMESDPRKGAAMFRNRITTLQHSELWRDFLTRMMAGARASYSRPDYRIVEEWFTRTLKK